METVNQSYSFSTPCKYEVQNPCKCHSLLKEGYLHVKSKIEGFFTKMLDNTSEVIEWGYEHESFLYLDKNEESHSYTPDFWFRTKQNEWWVEIKSKSEIDAPSDKNLAKWREADRLAQKHGARFEVFVDGCTWFMAYNELNNEGLIPLSEEVKSTSLT